MSALMGAPDVCVSNQDGLRPGPRPRRAVSERQLAANREKARRSTGPRTAAGKARSRLNATRHGLRAAPPPPVGHGEDAGADAAVSDADRQAYEAMHRAFQDDLRPDGPVERGLVYRIAWTAWQVRRADVAMEATLVEAATVTNPPKTVASVLAQQFEGDGDSPYLRLSRYQFKLEGGCRATLRKLLRGRDEKEQERRRSARDVRPRAGTNEPVVRPGVSQDRHTQHGLQTRVTGEAARRDTGLQPQPSGIRLFWSRWH